MTKLDKMLLELGHTENLLGTGYLRTAVDLYTPGTRFTKELYPAIAAAAGTTPDRVERAMRHSIERAWERGSIAAQETYFGYSIDPNTGRPTVSEYIARMAKLCHED